MEDNIQREIANMSSHDFCHRDLTAAMYKDCAHTLHRTLYVFLTMNNWYMGKRLLTAGITQNTSIHLGGKKCKDL
jgi:hypothetical protein